MSAKRPLADLTEDEMHHEIGAMRIREVFMAHGSAERAFAIELRRLAVRAVEAELARRKGGGE